MNKHTDKFQINAYITGRFDYRIFYDPYVGRFVRTFPTSSDKVAEVI